MGRSTRGRGSWSTLLLLLLLPALAAAPAVAAEPPADADLARSSLRADLTRETFYFVMPDRFQNGRTANDRGGLTGGRLTHGFDPTDKAFYHGGDLPGLRSRLDYLQDLGITSIWMTPSFKNRPVQATGASFSAGYHGYWITDFTQIDPHLGTNADLRALVRDAHARGMKVFFDIITNHTADVIAYAEGQYAYRSKGAYPYIDADGREFDDRAYAGSNDFPRLDLDSFPYTPVFRTPADRRVKRPRWLNDRTMYHNRGDSTFVGENSQYGDFFGLDDLFTERPEVVRGMIDIHKRWISDFGIDGYRVDTVKHVNTEFWQAFAPAIKRHARRVGKPDFFLFGEVFDGSPEFLSSYTTKARLPAVLDFGFQGAARGFASSAPTNSLRDLFLKDDLYTDADSNAYSLPTFLGNHDMGRIGHFLQRDNAGADDAELLARDRLAHELMYLSRGMPVVYYGDEQGFTGDGGDQDARQDMDGSEVASYNDDDLIGTDRTTATPSFEPGHPLYVALQGLAALTKAHPTLRDGAQIHRLSGDAAGVYAFSRITGSNGIEYVVALNNAETPQTATIPTFSAGVAFSALYPAGTADVTTGDDRGLTVTVPPLTAAVWRATAPLAAPSGAPTVTIAAPADGAEVEDRVEVRADVTGDGFHEVTFAMQAGDGPWQVLGTDDNPPYRVHPDVADIAGGTALTFKAVVRNHAGQTASDLGTATVSTPAPPPPPGGADRDHLIVHYQRTAADYDGWGLYLFGDVDASETTTWPANRPFRGEDEYGRFTWVKLAPGASNVGLIVQRNGTKDVEADRFVNPRQTPEIWLKEGDPTIYTSQAAAQGFVTVHYRRPAGDYADWGLHLWGDAVADGVGTDWAAPRQRDGVDAYGAFFRVPIKDAASPVNFIVHTPGGDAVPTTREPGGDRSFVPSRDADIWLVAGDERVHRSQAAAEGVAIVHLHRDDGDYSGWGLHVWAGAATPTDWTTPILPERIDAFGAVFRVPLAAGATSLSYIIHKGDTKDLPADQALDLVAVGHEVWILSGRPGYLLPVVGGGGPAVDEGDLAEQRAHLIDRTTVAWDVDAVPSHTYAMFYARTGGLTVEPTGLAGGRVIRLLPKAGGLTPEQRAAWPHLADLPAFAVDPRDLDRVRAALKGQLAVVERDRDGVLRAATGVQVAGALDDLYATRRTLGASIDGRGRVTLRLWAPTAHAVSLRLYPDAAAPGQGTTRRMAFDERSGTWSVTGPSSWKGRLYRYDVTVWAPSTQRVERNLVTDPYSLSLTTNSTHSRIVDLDDRGLAPRGWADLRKPRLAAPEDISLYELHVRDFSIGDETVPTAERGTYAAFARRSSNGMRHLRRLADAGLTHVHLLPVFDIATIEERRAAQRSPGDLSGFPPDSEEQQAAVTAVADEDGFNWGYDPLHYTTPEGSYSTDPSGNARIREFRSMVQSLNGSGLRVVMDVVYNHTAASGQDAKSVLDRIVPGYYHRLDEKGAVTTSTCCANTATEHRMMERLMVDSIVTWARDYKVDGFRFDLMGHHSKANMLRVRAALDALTLRRDGVDGRRIYLYGEGWNFGEVQDDARFVQATQLNMAGTGIGTFNDRLRDAVRGGGPFDADPRVQGFGSGLFTDPNGAPQGTAAEQRDRLLHAADLIRVGLTGNLRGFRLTDRTGATVTGADVRYNGAPAGYTDDPQESITYVSAHDNETLFDALALKLPQATTMADRVRMQIVSLSTVALGQGVPFFHAGTELLRSKSLDRNSYNSGDWFNRLDFTYTHNNFGVGLPPRPDNEEKWPFMRPLLADPALKADRTAILATRDRFEELLRIRRSSPLLRLRTGAEVQARVSFPGSGPDQTPGLVAMAVSDEAGQDLDGRFERILVLFNGGDTEASLSLGAEAGSGWSLHPVQAASVDPVVRTAAAADGTFTVPARTTAVFVR